MKKIAFFTKNIYTDGGTEKVVTLIANELCSHYNVTIISLFKTSNKTFYELNSHINIIDILDGVDNDFKKNFLSLRKKLRNSLKTNEFDFFINTDFEIVPISLGIKKDAKYIHWEHHNSFNCSPYSKSGIMKKILGKCAYKIIVLTDQERKRNIEVFQIKKDRIIRIYNPIENYHLSDKYDILSKKILSCGRLVGVKGFEMIPQIAKRVFNRHPDWKWHIYGDGPERENLQRLINQSQLQNHVVLKGQASNMLEIYKDYALFVMTSRAEGFPMVNIEAHCAKLPIVSFNCNCGPGEIIQDGVNGYLIDCFDTEKMAEKINDLIENEDVRKQMSDNTMIDKEKLNMKTIIKEWEKILNG